MSTRVVLAYASTGLGHLRVTNALFEAAPPEISPRLLRVKHSGATLLHRIMSAHPLARSLMEWSQNGAPETFFTKIYRGNLRHGGTEIERELRTLLEQEFEVVKTLVVIATHFGLAHEIAAAKPKLERELNVHIQLVVVVTDDSPQQLWYVEGADLIFAPSEMTQQALIRYGEKQGYLPVRIEVCAYPLSFKLSSLLPPVEWQMRKNQLNPGKFDLIQVLVPISGAAVSLDRVEQMMQLLYRKNPRFHFSVVSRENGHTKPFLDRMARKKYVSLITSKHDREVVTNYNKIVQNVSFAFEITKPSEQAFKAILSTRRRGGMILLFTEPVGRQERDNLSFLARHDLLNRHAYILPEKTSEAVSFITSKITDGSFLSTAKKRLNKSGQLTELSSHGSSEFWRRLRDFLLDK